MRELGAGFKAAFLHQDPDVYAVSGVASREECAAVAALFDSMMHDAARKPGRACLRSHSKLYHQAFEEWKGAAEAGGPKVWEGQRST